MALPIPCAPPTTMATWPLNRSGKFAYLFFIGRSRICETVIKQKQKCDLENGSNRHSCGCAKFRNCLAHSIGCGRASPRTLRHPDVENHFHSRAILRDAKCFLKLVE